MLYSILTTNMSLHMKCKIKNLEWLRVVFAVTPHPYPNWVCNAHFLSKYSCWDKPIIFRKYARKYQFSAKHESFNCSISLMSDYRCRMSVHIEWVQMQDACTYWVSTDAGWVYILSEYRCRMSVHIVMLVSTLPNNMHNNFSFPAFISNNVNVFWHFQGHRGLVRRRGWFNQSMVCWTGKLTSPCTQDCSTFQRQRHT